MTEQIKQNKGFCRAGFLMPIVFLFYLRKYIRAVVSLLILGLVIIHPGLALITVLYMLIIRIALGVSGKNDAYQIFENKEKLAKDLKTMLIIGIIVFALRLLVMVGIFAAALIPRLTSVRERAEDMARQADLQQMNLVLLQYKAENGEYPNYTGSFSELAAAGIDFLPTDPNPDMQVKIEGIVINQGEYGYLRLGSGFVLLAKTQTAAGSNRVGSGGNLIDGNYNPKNIPICENIIEGSQTKNFGDGNCSYQSEEDLGLVWVK